MNIAHPFRRHGANPVLNATVLVVCSAMLSAVLAACGGGGGGASTPVASGPVATTAKTLSGTVAVGAPIINATLTIKDANGTTRTATVGADGGYTGISVDGLVAPFQIQACGLVDGSYQCIYAVALKDGVANVTPITNATVTLALGKDASSMFGAGGHAPSTTELNAQSQQLATALGPVLTALGLPANLDFSTTAFKADRTGVDKLLDAVKVTTGTDYDANKNASTFVQIEGKIGKGNVYVNNNGTKVGALGGGSELGVDLTGITSLFERLNTALAKPTAAECAASMDSGNVFAANFLQNFGTGNFSTVTNAALTLCTMAQQEGLLGGSFANPIVEDCDFSGNAKTCHVGFQLMKADKILDAVEINVVLGSDTLWRLLGQDSVYTVHVNANAQRTVRVDVNAPTQTTYQRALSLDIVHFYPGAAPGTIRAARAYQRDAAGTGWDATPFASMELSDACLAGFNDAIANHTDASRFTRLATPGSACGSTWMPLAADAAGDALIDNFYKRGRQVRVEVYGDVAATQLLGTVVTRIGGVPPKADALPSQLWLELDAATLTSLVSYAGTPASFSAAWVSNPSTTAKDVTFCLSASCSGTNLGGFQEVHSVQSETRSAAITLSNTPASAAAFKEISLYGRTRDELGLVSNFISCGAAPTCPSN